MRLSRRVERLEDRINPQTPAINVRFDPEAPCQHHEHPTDEDCKHCPDLCVFVEFVKGESENYDR